ncbi:hypothetical protein ACQUFY_27440 (plasmid) [Robbsia andropogonis]|uniref:hypothetical protein n=1 Tax=Robbsia andropogonis TaxID=28092 RepID=UPI003D1E684D
MKHGDHAFQAVVEQERLRLLKRRLNTTLTVLQALANNAIKRAQLPLIWLGAKQLRERFQYIEFDPDMRHPGLLDTVMREVRRTRRNETGDCVLMPGARDE